MANLTQYEQTIALINQANDQDPNIETVDGKDWPKERLYSERMSDMIQRFAAEADEVQKISVHAQHIERWKSPRTDYTMDRKGYHQWRKDLYQFHADSTAKLMTQAGYDSESIERVKLAIGKKNIKENLDTQMLENIAALVFIEHYMLAFAEKHPEYNEEKWISIIRRTWDKMSKDAQKFSLQEGVQLPQSLIPLIIKAVS